MLSEAKKDHGKHFHVATDYAKDVMAGELAKQLGKRAYHLAFSAYFKGINRLYSTDTEN